MSEDIDEIFASDQLGRRGEAELILEVIEIELEERRRRGRSDAYVLALDAAYGEGKTWFLDRLQRLIALSHPVAVVDAWADDADQEPLTAFMAAIEDALSPYLSKGKAMSEHLAVARRAALPILGRAAAGAATKLASKVMGEGIDDAFGDAIEDAAVGLADRSEEEGALGKAAEAAIEKIGDEIDSLVDRRGAAVLADYRKRKKSRNAFRDSMAKLVASIDGDVSPPLFVVVDELDRCRPDYAIRVLEEIKHFFAVPNVVFVLALHGDQLAASVNAVYGAEFKSREYLQRFFTRRYKLRRLPLDEIVRQEVAQWDLRPETFRIQLDPFNAKSREKVDVAKEISTLCAELDVPARQALALLDLVQFFVGSWPHSVPINPMYLVVLALAHLRQVDVREVIEGLQSNRQLRSQDSQGQSVSEGLREAVTKLNNMARTDLSGFNWVNHYSTGGRYAANWIEGERTFAQGGIGGLPFLSEYANRINLVGKFVDLPRRKDNQADDIDES